MRTDREIYPASFLEISICCLTVTRPNKNTAELRPEEENRLWEGKWSSSVGDRVQQTMLFLSGTGLRSDLWLQEHGHHSSGPENHILLWKHSKILLVYKADLFINILNDLICRDMKNKDMPQSPWWNPNVNSTLKVFVILHLPTTEWGTVGHHVDPKWTIFSQDLQRSDQATGTNRDESWWVFFIKGFTRIWEKTKNVSTWNQTIRDKLVKTNWVLSTSQVQGQSGRVSKFIQISQWGSR